jgi:carbamoyltransferase
MNILGLLYLNQDPAASLMINGSLVSLAEEERFTRIKHAKGVFPEKSIRFCLNENRLSPSDIDCITVGWNVNAYKNRVQRCFEENNLLYKKDNLSQKWEHSQILTYNRTNYTSILINGLENSGFSRENIPPVKYYDHHYTHALSAYIPSKYNDAIILTIDGHGEENCTVVWVAKNGTIKKLKEYNIPHSLGWFYSAVTKFCGFESNDGEGKTMGLAPYGKRNTVIAHKLSKIIQHKEGDYKINPEFLIYGDKNYAKEFTDLFVSTFGPPRNKNSDEISSYYQDFAYESQLLLEEVVCNIVRGAIKQTGIKNVCLSGGVALNCKMNGVIASMPEVENAYVQPISNDVGTTFGSSFAFCLENKYKISPSVLEHVYLGPEESDEMVLKSLNNKDLNFSYIKNIEETTANLLANGHIIGWFQGKMEAGKRALGNRSILGDPRRKEIKDLINNKVKFREPWRPFCPSILEEYQHEFIEDVFYHPFMIIAFKVKKEKISSIPSVVHIDNTVRIQSVSKKINERYWNLINEFYKLTGVPILLNTSFNLKGEPIVCTSEDAISTFIKTDMDYLVINNFLIKKNERHS